MEDALDQAAEAGSATESGAEMPEGYADQNTDGDDGDGLGDGVEMRWATVHLANGIISRFDADPADLEEALKRWDAGEPLVIKNGHGEVLHIQSKAVIMIQHQNGNHLRMEMARDAEEKARADAAAKLAGLADGVRRRR